jgi:hypothetical protein
MVVLLALAMGMLLLLTPLGQAQTFRGRIQGIVTDESKAVVANASVTLLNINTGIKEVHQTSGTGLYVFDNVDPGTYTITVEISGFSRYEQENILMQSGGDVTVNVGLKVGSVTNTVTVTETPVAVDFNDANKDMTIDSTMASEVPRLDRNPFKLTLLAPSAINTRGEMQPYHSWSMNSVDLGGDTNLANDLQVDGSPIGLGHKGSYPPNTDDVQEVVVAQNSVDAESGHSAGGIISMTTKSGTNDWHGDAFYLGRYPWASAEADRTTFSANAQRQNMYGGTLGAPILKNKLFNFSSAEVWEVGYPNSYVTTVPTALEQQGDFSKSYNIAGGIRTVYDPWTTVLNPDGSVTRTPFAGNVIPATRFDSVTGGLMKQFWAPNNPGDNITGVNNYKKGFIEKYTYYNFTERVDYNITDRWKIFGRVSRYYTTDLAGNPTPDATTELYVPTGTLRGAWQGSGDAIFTLNPRTVFDFHGDWHDVIDAYVSTPLGAGGWSKIWPNSSWYEPYTSADTGVPLYFPNLNIGGNGFGGGGFYWDQRPKGESFSGKVSHQIGSHFLKAGGEWRRSSGFTYVSSTTSFLFNQSVTASTYINPNTLVNGDQWATFLLGALDNSSYMIGGPAPDPYTQFYGMFFQDDWKLSRRITLNLGIRNEYETAWYDPNHELSKGLDLSQPTPEMVANPPNMSIISQTIPGLTTNPIWNGLWNFTSSSSPGMWNAPKLALQPRAGIAFRVDDKTSLRAGYARYTIPTEFNMTNAPGFETVSFLEPPFFGYTGYQNTAPLLEGVPQETFSDPFPASDPLLPVIGKGFGTNVGRGQNGALMWYDQNFKKAYNDRFNFSFQRQLPGQIVGSATYFVNFGHQLYNEVFNNLNPAYEVQYQSLLSTSVPNPFYHYLNQTIMPGPLYNEATVPLSTLLTTYPQYSSLSQAGTCCVPERYQSVELKAQKVFSHGFNFLFAYVYIHEKGPYQLNDAEVYNNVYEMQDSDQPSHRVSAAGTYELPFGKGRTYASNISRPADWVIGGWKVTGVFTFMTGDHPRFYDTMIVNGNPCISNPTPGQWFNTGAFSEEPVNTYVLRSNPLQYGCLTGPKFADLDATLSKDFKITEKIKTELKMNAYNATNRLNRGDPVTDIYNSSFGKALYQGSPGGTFGVQGGTYGPGNSGRQLEFGLKVIF